MKFLSNAIFNGTITANSVADAGTNTDKFLVLNSSGVVTYRTAAELYTDLGIGSLPAGYTSTVKHQVKAGVAVTKGQAVYVTSADGTNMIIGKASNAAESTSSKTMGLIESTLSTNGIGNVVTEGLLAGLNTTGANAAGDPVWLGTNGDLIYGLANKPYAPAHLVFIGIVTRVNANNGEIFVKVQNGFELKEIHDIDLITTTPINGHILGYDGTLWVNKTIAGWLGYTPISLSSLSATAPLSYNSGTGAFTIATANTSTTGALSSTDWNTFNGKQSAITLTTTGSSGSSTFSAGTLNIPTYTLSGLGGVSTARTLTINGTTYDLSADRSWTISTSASARNVQKFTSTASQTTFTISGGYTPGLVDVFVNGVKLDNATDFTASNGTTVVLTDALIVGQTVEVYNYITAFTANNSLRQTTAFTATAGQTSFTVSYSPNFVDVFYNGSKLAASEYTATSGTAIVLATACLVNDIVEVVAYNYTVGAFTGIGGSGTTNYVPKFTASGTIGDSNITDTGSLITLGSNSFVNGSLSVGTNNPNGWVAGLVTSNSFTGGTSVYGNIADGTIQSGVTNTAGYFRSQSATAAASFTLSNLNHFDARQATFGAGSVITTQRGFWAGASLVGATNNYAFQGSIPSGANRWNLFMDGTANNYMAGSLGIGSPSLTGRSLQIGKNITGATLSFGVLSNGTVQSDVTSQVNNFTSTLITVASAFTLPIYYHYIASQGPIGSTSAVTNQYGFAVENTLIGATNNFGFYGNIPSGANRWNLYMNGTANNYMAGRLGIGVINPSYELDVFNGSANSGIVANTNNNGFAGYVSSFNSAYGNAIQMRSYGNTTASTIFGISTNGMNALWSNGDTIYAIGTIGATAMVFGTNNTERIRVKSTGQMRFVPLASDPTGAQAGDIYYNSTTNALKLYDGTQWRTITVV